MSVHALTMKTRTHWAEWLPEKTRNLKAAGMWEVATQDAAMAVQQEIMSLMRMGYQEHEAEEVALPTYVLLRPEDDAMECDESRRELEQMEIEYRKNPPVI